MIIELSGVKINFKFFNKVENNKPCILFLHGFTGSLDDWDPIYRRINQDFSSAGIDIIGHGKSDSPGNTEFYSADAIADQINGIVENIINSKVIPIGYSMGGRAALTFTVKHPKIVEALILESTSPGIENKRLREERVKKDEEIAAYIETHSPEDFADYWMDMEIFNTQRRFSEEKRKQLRETRIKNNPVGLANSLRGFGTGTMPPHYDDLKNINCRILLITGELDTKFTNINNEIVQLFQRAGHTIIKNAGHNTHIEEPEKFIEAVNNFLQ